MTTANVACAATFDADRSEAFCARLLGTLNEAGLALMLSIGHRTGLFRTMGEMPPATSPAIAERADLDERYVREWLGAMVTGGVIDYDAEASTYWLPPEHAALLGHGAGADNIACTMQWIAVLASVEDEVVDSFRHGGGVGYCRFHRFHEVMAAESAQTVVAALDDILPLASGAATRLASGAAVLDVGCGSGRAMNHLAGAFPASRFTGYDLCDDAIAAAQAEAAATGRANTRFEVRDVTRLGDESAYDLVTAFDSIHDQKDPAAVLAEIFAALKPGGTFLMQDIAASSHLHKNLEHPLGPFLYTISTMHCMTVSLEQGGAGLGTVWGEELAVQMLHEAGFTGVEVKTLPHDIMNNYYVATKPA